MKALAGQETIMQQCGLDPVNDNSMTRVSLGPEMKHPKNAFRLRNRSWFPWLFLGLCVVVIPLIYWLLPPEKKIEGLLPTLGVVGAFVGFLYSQHLQQTRLFSELFTEFNQRYDKLNEQLNAICARPEGSPLDDNDANVLFDYFNLCAEEYLFFSAGYIDLDVWQSWYRGMEVFIKDPEIRGLWEKELKSGSYYGFTIGGPPRG